MGAGVARPAGRLRFERAFVGAVCVLLAFVFAYLACYCLVYTSVLDPENYFGEHILRRRDPFVQNLLVPLCLFVLLRLALRFERRVSLPLATGLLLSVVLLAGGAWVFLIQINPRADAQSLYLAAEALIRGDVSSFVEPGSYFHIYPHQSGYVLFSELLQRLFGERCYVQIGLVNAAALAASYGAVLDILWHSLHDRRVQLCAVLLLAACLQPLLYVTFLYGNLPGLPFALWGVACAVRWAKGGRTALLALSAVLVTIAVPIKLNYMIVAFALAIMLAVHAIASRRLRALPFALLMVFLPFAATGAAQRALEARTGASFGPGTPQTAWLAMGLQEGSRAAGWYNQYTGTLLEKNGFDASAAALQAKEDIQTRLGVFRDDPAYAVSFFHSKLATQWAETTFESIWINKTAKHEPNRPALADALLAKPVTGPVERYMKGYTTLLYAAFAAGLIRLIRLRLGASGISSPSAFGLSVLAVSVFGGLSYHLLFEAKSQYLFVYLPMMTPFAALALSYAPRHAAKPPSDLK